MSDQMYYEYASKLKKAFAITNSMITDYRLSELLKKADTFSKHNFNTLINNVAKSEYARYLLKRDFRGREIEKVLDTIFKKVEDEMGDKDLKKIDDPEKYIDGIKKEEIKKEDEKVSAWKEKVSSILKTKQEVSKPSKSLLRTKQNIKKAHELVDKRANVDALTKDFLEKNRWIKDHARFKEIYKEKLALKLTPKEALIPASRQYERENGKA